MLEVTVGMEGDVVVLDVSGSIVASTIEELRGHIDKLVEKNFTRIMLDLSKVSFMDSSGLGSCVATHKQLSEKGGILVCARPSEAVSKIFRVTRADQRIAVVPTRIDGLKLIQEKMKK